jgi:hypothetical protein
VITRMWRGWAPADRASEYERHYRDEVLPALGGVAGHYDTVFETS